MNAELLRPGDDAELDIDVMYARHAAFLANVIRRLAGEGAHVDDLLQESFLAAFRQRRTFERRAAVRTWLYGIARNLTLKHLRSRRTRRMLSLALSRREVLEPPVRPDIGNKVTVCMPPGPCDVTPNLPFPGKVGDLLELTVTWAPLRFRPLPLWSQPSEVFLLAGVGVNGLRRYSVQANTAGEYTISETGGGLSQDPKWNYTLGAGLHLVIVGGLYLRAELRLLSYRDEFDFEQDGSPSTYTYTNYFAHAGMGYAVF